MKLEWVFGVLMLGVAGAGVGLWMWSQDFAALNTADAGAGGGGRAENAAPAQAAPLAPSPAVPEVVEAPIPQRPRDLLAVVAEWAKERLHGCPLTKARLPDERGYIRFRVSPDFGLLDARLIDIESGAEISDECFERVFSELRPREAASQNAVRRDAGLSRVVRRDGGLARAVSPDASTPDAGAPELTVWWPLRSGDGKMRDIDSPPPSQPRVPGVEMLMVPHSYPVAWLPAGGLVGPWLGLCRAARKVTLSSTPDEENSDFVTVWVHGCGESMPASVPAILKEGLSAKPETQLADVHVSSASLKPEVTIGLGADRYRLWEIDWEAASGVQEAILGLRSGETVQVLATQDNPDWGFEVIWAGDLDRDERIDLVIRDDEPDEGHYRLFLSNAQRTLPVLLAAERQLPGD